MPSTYIHYQEFIPLIRKILPLISHHTLQIVIQQSPSMTHHYHLVTYPNTAQLYPNSISYPVYYTNQSQILCLTNCLN